MTKELSIIQPIQLGKEVSVCNVNVAGFSLDNFKTMNPEGYTIICNLGETCNGLTYFPNTAKIVLDSNQQSLLMHNFDQFVPKVAEDLSITPELAFDKSVDFFADTTIVVRPTGIQGAVYTIMLNVQNFAPIKAVSSAISSFKTTGLTGTQIVTKAPMTFVGGTYLGAMFFIYMGGVTGNTPLSRLCNATGYVLALPMKGVEVTLNNIILRPISHVIGLPLVLNGTQELLHGNGLSLEESTKLAISFERILNSRVAKTIKGAVKSWRESGGKG